MDICQFGNKALLIPTPGQSEQEYLARLLSEKKYFATQRQSILDLELGINQAKMASGLYLPQNHKLQHNILDQFISICQNGK